MKGFPVWRWTEDQAQLTDAEADLHSVHVTEIENKLENLFSIPLNYFPPRLVSWRRGVFGIWKKHYGSCSAPLHIGPQSHKGQR